METTRSLSVLEVAVVVVAITSLVSGAALAQSSTVLMTTGPGVAEFEDIDGLDNGDWFALINANFVSPNEVRLVRNGALLHAQGDPVSIPGVVIGDGDGVGPRRPFVDMNPSRLCPQPQLGILALVDDTDPGTPPVITDANDRGLFWGSTLLIQEGSVTTAPEVPAGTRIKALHHSCTNALQDVLLLTTLADPVTNEEYSALLLADLDTTCSSTPTVRQQVLFKKGDVATNGVMTSLAADEKRSFAYNARGDWMCIAAFDAPFDRAIVLNGRRILRETQPLPGAQGAATSLQVASVDLNDSGDFVIQTRGTTGTILIKGSVFEFGTQTKFIRVNEPLPDPDLGPFVLARIGNSTRVGNGAARNWAPVILTNSGDVIWYGEWMQGAEIHAAIFINHKALVRTGSVQGGALIDRIGSLGAELRYEIEASPNGRYLLFEAGAGFPIFQDAIFRMDLGESVPYGTVAEGCAYPYPNPGLQHVSDDPRFGDPLGFGGFPLRNDKDFFLRVDAPAPPGASQIAVVFTRAASSDPCGTPFLGTQVLLDGPFLIPPLVQPTFQRAFGFRVPSSVPPDFVGYAQAFFLRPDGQVLGATNGIRFVFGSP